MPLKSEIQVHLPRSLQANLPPAGQLVQSHDKASKAIFRFLGVRDLVGTKTVVVRLEPIPRAQRSSITEAVTPWPRHPKSGRPVVSRETQTGPIITKAQRAKADRLRAVELLSDDRADNLIPTARLKNGTIHDAEWRDPADLNPNRRDPRVIRGKRAHDAIEFFTEIGTFDKRQAASARRLRDQFDRAGGIRIGYDRMTNVGSGFGPSAGLSEQQLAAMEVFGAARDAVGPSLWQILFWVVLDDQHLNAIARRLGQQAYQVQQRLLSAVDRLSDHYRSLEDARKRESLDTHPA